MLKSNGFTLLELLVALAVFAVVAALAYGGLNSVIAVHTSTHIQAKRLSALQRAIARIEQDLTQYTHRAIRDEYGSLQPALSSLGRDLSLTRHGWRNPLKQKRSHLQRIRYVLENGELQRWYWRTLDRAQDSQPLRVTILTEVADIQWQFLDTQSEWQTTWQDDFPPDDINHHSDLTKHAIIRAVKMHLQLQDGSEFTRLFRLVGA